MFSHKRGQTTVEVIMFFALALLFLVIILASFTDLTFITSISESSIEQQYFLKQPIVVRGISVSASNTTLYLINTAFENLTIHNMTFDDIPTFVGETTLIPGSVTTIVSTSLNETASPFRDREVVVQFNYTLVESSQTFLRSIVFPKKVSIIES